MERNLAMFRKKTPQDVQFARAAEQQRCRLASVCDMCVEQLSEHVHKQAMEQMNAMQDKLEREHNNNMLAYDFTTARGNLRRAARQAKVAQDVNTAMRRQFDARVHEREFLAYSDALKQLGNSAAQKHLVDFATLLRRQAVRAVTRLRRYCNVQQETLAARHATSLAELSSSSRTALVLVAVCEQLLTEAEACVQELTDDLMGVDLVADADCHHERLMGDRVGHCRHEFVPRERDCDAPDVSDAALDPPLVLRLRRERHKHALAQLLEQEEQADAHEDEATKKADESVKETPRPGSVLVKHADTSRRFG